jgi:glycosyltransferase involved in cell wall biosynthesis
MIGSELHGALRNAPGQDLKGLRVAILTSGHEALDARVYDREARSLQEMGADVVVIASLERGKQGSVPVIALKAPRSRLERFVIQPWRCFRATRRFRPDIVHFHDAELLALLPIGRIVWPHTWFVYDVHEDFGNLLLIRDWLHPTVRTAAAAVTNFAEKSLARLAHGIVGVTPPLTNNFPHRHRTTAFNFPSRRFYERAGRFARPPLEREYDLAHLGTLSMRRAVFLADVVRAFHEKRPAARSLIFGCSPEIQSYLQDKVPERCTVRAMVPYDEVAAILGNARIGIDIHPWLGPHLRLAFAVKLSEYMASGCAVVASWMPVLEDILSHVQVDPGSFRIIRGESPEEYAGAVCDLLERIAGGDNPGESLRSAAMSTLVWEEEAKKIAALYRDLVEQDARNDSRRSRL